MPVLDFHARLHPGGMDGLLAAMDYHGIDRAVVSAGGVIDPYRLSDQIIWGGHIESDADNEAVLATCTASGGRLLPRYFANPHRDPSEYHAWGPDFCGVEISPAVHGVPLTDERTIALVEVAESVGHAVYIVSLGRAGCGSRDLAFLASKFPAVRFVLGHCGFIGIDFGAIKDVADLGNVFAETSGCYLAVVRVALERLGAERLLFGTEYPGQDPGVELAKYRALDISLEQWRLISWTNGAPLLSIGGVTDD
ncbi:amidohydrolase family protein [Phytoactinopolyspora limicola]|uniref:amidohydrolase family protein n=1 Tax=Phytoactinopolyspora limicola TaxID=2715536 RepID=UPI001A9CA2D9|nr:amidohydrolase family protein [Phytoactinopolyspora limicola]